MNCECYSQRTGRKDDGYIPPNMRPQHVGTAPRFPLQDSDGYQVLCDPSRGGVHEFLGGSSS